MLTKKKCNRLELKFTVILVPCDDGEPIQKEGWGMKRSLSNLEKCLKYILKKYPGYMIEATTDLEEK